MTEIIPVKLIIELNPDGTIRDGVLQYQKRVSGAIDRKYFTMGIKDGINIPNLEKIVQDGKSHVENGELKTITTT